MTMPMFDTEPVNGVDYLTEALKIIQTLACEGRVFTADDVHERLPHGLAAPSNGAMGCAFRLAHNIGAIRPVGYTKPRRASRHGNVIRAWRHGIY